MNEEQKVPEEKFWMILRRTGNSAPSKRHSRKDIAVKEGQRLARQSGEGYYLLEAVGIVEPEELPVKYRSIE
jgi:hypothetical protein